MSYINVTVNHFRAIQKWAAETGGRATLDVATFQLEVKHRNRYFQLLPQFTAWIDGRLSHVPSLVDGVFGFAGWLPYRPYSLELSTDKLSFKRFVADAGLRTPAAWPDAASAERDFILKRSKGSFGIQLAGPFRIEQRLSATPGAAARGRGELFAEEFIAGDILKAWFWGSRLFFVHVQRYLSVTGDGARAIEDLARERMGQLPDEWPGSPDRAIAAACASYQGRRMEEPVDFGVPVWIDFRYGRATGRAPGTSRSDNALDELSDATRRHIEDVGRRVGAELGRLLAAPVAFTLDGVIDASGEVWWLEMNSNPIFPAEGYASMFEDLFS
jgi:hypothetical protein